MDFMKEAEERMKDSPSVKEPEKGWKLTEMEQFRFADHPPAMKDGKMWSCERCHCLGLKLIDPIYDPLFENGVASYWCLHCGPCSRMQYLDR